MRFHIRPYAIPAVLVAMLILPNTLHAQNTPSETGWQTNYIGAWRGDLSVSLGAQFWQDYFHVRNLIARSSIDLAPGIRAHLGLRRRENNWQRSPIHPDIDEAYMEASSFYHSPEYRLSLNIKAGRSRYLRFPEPDLISYFDQVPGISDLTDSTVTDYRGFIPSAEFTHRSGFGAHASGIQWAFDSKQHGANAIDAYAFYRRAFAGGWTFESRYGAIASRPEPLGLSPKQGGDLLIAKRLGEFEVGALYEKRNTEHAYTGIMVRFRPTTVTKALGAVGFDYARTPEGFAVQYDLFHMRINEATCARKGDELVGEVKALRLRTYWEQSFQRNQYEHRLESWGECEGNGIYAVVDEQPWYLESESLVSPHTSINSQWFHDRQGPAQLAQEVTYRFYRRKTQ